METRASHIRASTSKYCKGLNDWNMTGIGFWSMLYYNYHEEPPPPMVLVVLRPLHYGAKLLRLPAPGRQSANALEACHQQALAAACA